MRKILYFIYFVLKTDYKKLKNEIRKLSSCENIVSIRIVFDMIISTFKYKSSFQDYFLFNFYEKNDEERKAYLTTGKLYELHSRLNDKKFTYNFKDKLEFNKKFSDFIKRDYLFIPDATIDEFKAFMLNKKTIIAKPKEGAAGIGIEKIDVRKFPDVEKLFSYLIDNKIELVEEFIVQHPKMNKMNPSSVNTIRIITVRWNGDTNLIYGFLRIGVDGHIDNFSAGGLAAPIDLKSGFVSDSGRAKDFSKRYEYHPRTNIRIKGFKIPYWDETISLVIEASKVIPEVRTVGWDIAIGIDGPELIEGNDNWGKDAFQLLDGVGKAHMFDKYK